MVKVLDARPVNGNFWVFFGALSNVQYAVTVTDTVTGTYRKYVNPSGSFASVGDTSAFRGGYSVNPAPDSANAVSMDLDQIGGSVSAVGADGTVFTLEIPPYALPAPTTVTLTPVSRVDRLPFSGGLVAGIEIAPEGKDLLLPATLTIQPASPPPPDRTLPFAYASDGQDLILYPRDPDSASLSLPIARLGGFGVGQGPPADADAQLQRKPTGALAVYLQRYAGEVLRYEQKLIDRAQLTDSGIQIYRDAVTDLGHSPVDASSARRAEGALNTRCIFQDRWGHDYDVGLDVQGLLGIIRQRQMLGLEDDESTQALYDEIINILKTCMQNAFNRCVANTDPYEALQMLQIAQQLSVLGVEDERLTSFVEDSLLERCLRFEIDFESKIVEEATRSGGGASVSSEENMTYRAQTVPLRLDLNNFYAAPHGAHDGECKLVPELTEFHYTAGTEMHRDGHQCHERPFQRRRRLDRHTQPQSLDERDRSPLRPRRPRNQGLSEMPGGARNRYRPLDLRTGLRDPSRQRVLVLRPLRGEAVGTAPHRPGPEPERRVLRQEELRAFDPRSVRRRGA